MADRDSADSGERYIADLERAITVAGFEVVRGDFMLASGQHTCVVVRPVDGRKLLSAAMKCPPFVEAS
jgi:hypothetical protein